MREYKNYIFLGALWASCFIGALHGSHDGDKELLAFSIDSAKQVLAAILTVTTVAVASRSTDRPNGGTNVTTTKTDSPNPTPASTPGVGLPTYPKQS
jgi:hypothetical protein